MITNGVVSIEDGAKASEEFAPARKVRVELTFATQEDGSESAAETLERVSQIANAKVSELLGRGTVLATGGTVQKVQTEKPAEKATTRKKKAETKPAGEKTKADLEAELIAELTGGTPPATQAAEPEPDGIDDLLGDQAPVPITDAELAKAAQLKNAQMKTKDPNFAVKIRALVVEYAGQPPKKITDIPVAKRQEFMDKLKDLS